MLSQETIDTVKSTVPLLETHGQTITRCFYEKLFSAHPELKNVFNQVNQTRGDQPRALADAVIAYAANIDNLEALLPAVTRIAHKHTSLGITPQQYPLVGANLLAAIQEVLELPEDHPALAAWAQAYDVLASVFINAEESLYLNNEQKTNGWRGFKSFAINNIETETADVKSFYLSPSDGSGVPTFIGGQYVGLKATPSESEFDEIRQYSISGQADAKHLRISTKAEPHGLVSSHLHQCEVGDTVLLQMPSGVFNLDKTVKKHVFIAGGVGITPLAGMLYETLNQGTAANDILFIQCARDSKSFIFKNELHGLQTKKSIKLKTSVEFGDDSDCQGYLTKAVIEQWLSEGDFSNDDSAVYFCGPLPFMKALNSIFIELEFPLHRIHYETFGPNAAL